MSEELRIRERLALLLMSNDDDAKRLVIFLIYKTIAKNNGITINQLTKLMRQKYALDKRKVDAALVPLTGDQILDAVTTWEEKDNKIVHLRTKETDIIKDWLANFCQRVPEICDYEAPLFVNTRRPNGATTFTEV